MGNCNQFNQSENRKEVKLIDANEWIEYFEEELGIWKHPESLDWALIKLKNAKPIDLESLRPHGKWNVVEVHGTYTIFACSECSREEEATNDYLGKPTEHIAQKYPYCHCGAKMQGVK